MSENVKVFARRQRQDYDNTSTFSLKTAELKTDASAAKAQMLFAFNPICIAERPKLYKILAFSSALELRDSDHGFRNSLIWVCTVCPVTALDKRII